MQLSHGYQDYISQPCSPGAKFGWSGYHMVNFVIEYIQALRLFLLNVGFKSNFILGDGTLSELSGPHN